MCVEPGPYSPGRICQDYARIPAGTLLLCVAGDDDHIVGEATARLIFTTATTVARADKDYILVRSDSHGRPALHATHVAPAGNGFASWYGYWKWCDALTAAAFTGHDRAYALGNTPEQRFLGTWSDGTAVIEPVLASTDP
jgi:hypothetical protein